MSASSSISTVIHGSDGRMGSQMVQAVHKAPDMQLAEGIPRIDRLSKSQRAHIVALQPNVVVDFSLEPGPQAGVELAIECGCPYLVGTTGMSQQTTEKIVLACSSLPVMCAPNTALLATRFRQLATMIAHDLPQDVEITIEETHHVSKRDAPSGTALDIAGEIDRHQPHLNVHQNIISHRVDGATPTHEITLKGAQEILKIFHHARSNRAYAQGALEAIRWLVDQQPGQYSMVDMYSKPQ